MKITKILLLIGTFGIQGNIFAEDLSATPQVKLNGLFHFQSAFRNQNNLANDEKNLSGNRKDIAFFTEANVMANISNTTENNLTYGAKIYLLTTTLPKTLYTFNGSHLFVETSYGKIEAGSPQDSGSKMRILAYDIASATGDDWNRYPNFKSTNLQYANLAPEFLVDTNYAFDTLYVTSSGQFNDGTELSRKISYFTPKFNGVQFGISYIPDSGNAGNANFNSTLTALQEITISQIPGYDHAVINFNNNVKDAFTGGISYEYSIADGVDMQMAVTGEYGKAANKVTETRYLLNNTGTTELQYKLSDLKTYNLGAKLNYGNFTYALAYGNLGKSLTAKEYHKTGRNSEFYNGAVGYGQGPISASVAYFKSSQYKNTVDAITLGTDYKLTPGLLPYAEITYFYAKGRPTYYPLAPKKKTRGTVALIGARLSM